MINQTEEFVSESWRYVSTHLESEKRADEILHYAGVAKDEISSILDVGCGNGALLKSLYDCYGAETAVGVEPSAEAVALLNEKYKDSDNFRFETASVHDLPFESDSFDMVTIWSVLHWVGRNEYLQSLGELCRVTRKYLCVMDFCAAEDYRVPYHHKEGMYTYKADFEAPLLASGVLSVRDKKRWWVDPETKAMEILEEKDLLPFSGNKKNFFSRKLVVFEKNHSLMQVLNADDFI